MSTDPDYRPASWLRELFRLERAEWPLGLCVRAGVCVAGPLAVGVATGHMHTAMWIAMATLNMAAGEGSGTYRSRFRQMAIAVPIAAIGYLAGYLMVLPYPAVIAILFAFSFLSGIVNSYGAPFSIGTMQALLLASLAIGLPEIAPFWQPAALYLLGGGLYALALGCEALIDRRRPEHEMLADHLQALAALADIRARATGGDQETPEIETARRRATDGSRKLYATLLEKRRGGRTLESLHLAATLDAADLTFSAILASSDPAALRSAAGSLRALADWRNGAAAAAAPAADASSPDRLAQRVTALARAMGEGKRDGGPSMADRPRPGLGARLAAIASRLIVGRAVLVTALALAICMAAAFAARYFVPADHWYWIPLTVALVMKADLGSIFARAALRVAGTSIGVAIGAALLILLPQGMGLVAAIGVFAAMLPWAKRVSYAAQTLFLTPLILILIDMVTPAADTIGFVLERFIDTAIGGAIVLVLGYFLWPRRHARELAADFGSAMTVIAGYFVAVCEQGGKDDAARAASRRRILDARRASYSALSDLRATLSRSMAEPPPAGREAAAWFPIVAGAERLCDRITTHAANWRPGDPVPDPERVSRIASVLRRIGEADAERPKPPDGAGSNDFLDAVGDDASQIALKLERAAAPPGGRAGSRDPNDARGRNEPPEPAAASTRTT